MSETGQAIALIREAIKEIEAWNLAQDSIVNQTDESLSRLKTLRERIDILTWVGSLAPAEETGFGDLSAMGGVGQRRQPPF